ncbi:MAG: HlyC/CorC family transporter [Alphaproteobacteria bacterium]|nr:HlyC/CorC family transporter [Alphaproteobacteria bacterium]
MGTELYLLIILVLILANGLFALAEMAVIASRRGRLRAMARRDKGAKAALSLAEHPSRFLSTIQVGINLFGILAGAFGGATLAEDLAVWLKGAGVPANYAYFLAFSIVVAPIWYLQLILGELVPKRLAIANPERIAARTAGAMIWISRLLSPFVAVVNGSSTLVLRLMGVRSTDIAKVTEEEIRHLVQEGAEEGAILSVERDMVNRVFRLGDKTVDEVMTPRPQMVALNADDPTEENLRRMRETNFSRYPVTKGEGDEWIGILRAKDLAFLVGDGKQVNLFGTLRPPLFVPDTTPALSMLDQFKKAGIHMALVVDEYGEVRGLVTPADIMEAIVGEMAATPGSAASSIMRRADGSWLVDALMAADELKEPLGLAELPGEAEHDYNTVAGLMLAQLERIPREGDSFDWQNYRFEVIDMDGRRVDKVLISPLAKAEEHETA